MKKGRIIGGVIVALVVIAGVVVALEPSRLDSVRGLFQDKNSFKGKSKADWIAALKSDDEKARRKAIFTLGWKDEGGETPVPILVDASRNDDAHVRAGAMQALAALDADVSRPALPEITKCLKDSDPEVRAHAEDALKRFGPEAKNTVPDLIDNLKDDNSKVRQNAAAALASMGADAQEAIPQLRKNYKDYQESDPTTSKTAGQAIAQIDPDEAKKLGIQIKQFERLKGPAIGP